MIAHDSPTQLVHLVLFPLAALALMAPLLAIFAPLGLAPLGAVVGLALLLLAASGRLSFPPMRTPLILLVAAVLLWAALSAIWAIDAERSTRAIGRLALIAIAATMTIHAAASLDSGDRRLVGLILCGSLTVASILLLVEILAGAPISVLLNGPTLSGDDLANYNRSASVLSIMVWPAAFAGWRYLGRAFAIALLLTTVFVLSQLNSAAPTLAVLAGLLTCAMGILARRTTALFLAAAIIVLTLATPALPQITPFLDRALASANYVDPGVNHRLRIWDYVAGRAHQRPLRGWGLDAARSLSNDRDRVTIQTTREGTTTSAEVVPLHPHNATLQVWVELGLPGALFIAALLLWTVWSVLSRVPGRLEAAICFAAIASALVSAELSFGIWQGWWQATLWLSAALTIAIAAPLRAAPG